MDGGFSAYPRNNVTQDGIFEMEKEENIRVFSLPMVFSVMKEKNRFYDDMIKIPSNDSIMK
jgi:hypothetical protein